MIYKRDTHLHIMKGCFLVSLRGVSIQNYKGTRPDILDKLDKLL